MFHSIIYRVLSLGFQYIAQIERLVLILETMFCLQSGEQLIDSVGNIHQSQNYQITNYHTLNYFEINYHLSTLKGDPILIGLGYSWIYNGIGENIRFITDYGYSALSISAKYFISWYIIEFRSDIPFDINEFSGWKTGSTLFPLSLVVMYRFKPNISRGKH